MAKEVMHRNASDNEYLHKDFHGALSCGIEYLHEKYGEEAVEKFLRDFTLTYYAPLRDALKSDGLVALKDYFQTLYEAEGGDAQITLTDDELVIKTAFCPAVTHMREHDYEVARLFSATTRTVNEVLCEGTPFGAELVDYDEQTGKSTQRFYRRQQ